jgi:glutathione S-transferase
MSNAKPLRMLTFGPMIDSELSRFLLWRYALPFHEERHIFGWASVLALLHGGTGRIPLIYGSGVKLTGPRAIIDYYEMRCKASQVLLPAQEPLRSRVEADWASFNGELAAYTAKIAYFYLLPHRDILLEPFVRGIPSLEAKLTPTLYPALRSIFTLLLGLRPAVVADSLEQAKRIVDGADRRISDGRRFLCGDEVTLSDLSFATALAPLLLPDGYTAPIPPYEQMPADLRQVIDAFRQRPSSALVSRIYALRQELPVRTGQADFVHQ